MGKRENVLRFCEEQRNDMERCWRKLGRYETNGNAYCAWVFATHEPGGPETWTPEDWPPGPPMERPRPIRVELPSWARLLRPNDRNTDLFGSTLRKLARATRAEGVLICSEMWCKEYGDPGDPNFDEGKARRLRAEDPESLEDAPGREEALFMSLEHVAVGRRAWCATIRRSPDRLDPWKTLDMTTSPLTDRLTGIVDTST